MDRARCLVYLGRDYFHYYSIQKNVTKFLEDNETANGDMWEIEVMIIFIYCVLYHVQKYLPKTILWHSCLEQ